MALADGAAADYSSMTDSSSSGSAPFEMSTRVFKGMIMAVLLVITVASALAPLRISQHGTSASRNLLARKLPFATAGVFIRSGLLHLLPDAVKLYDQLLQSMDAPGPAKWMSEFPVVYLLSSLGCMVVWGVGLLNMGDSD